MRLPRFMQSGRERRLEAELDFQGARLEVLQRELNAIKTNDTDVASASAYTYSPYDLLIPGYAIPHVDDLIRERGLSVYREMVDNDEQCTAVTQLPVYGLLSGGSPRIVPGGPQPIDEQAAAFCQHVFDGLEGSSLMRLIMNAFDSLALTFSVQEIVWRDPYVEGEWRNKQAIRTFVPLPQETVTFELDDHGTMLDDGVWQHKNHQAISGSRDPSWFNKMPREKFAIWTWRPRYGGPYGISILRPAHRWYVMKELVIRRWAKYIETFGMPVIDAAIPPSSFKAQESDVRARLELWQTTQRIVRRADTTVSFTFPPGHGEAQGAFEAAVQAADRGIAKAGLLPALVMDAGQTGSWALGQSQRLTFTMVLQNMQHTNADELLREQIMSRIVRRNFPGAAVPMAVFPELNDKDLNTLVNVAAGLVNLGLDIPKQYIREATGIPKPEEDEEVLIRGPEGPVGTPPQPGDPGWQRLQVARGLAEGDRYLAALLADYEHGSRDRTGAGAVEALRGNGKRLRAVASRPWR